jgi:tetratricopeptide (TPR) repeat protein
MTAQNNQELKGSFADYPLAELLVEIRQAALSGSLRIADGSRRSILYFRGGSVVFAVSNSRGLRLYRRLLEKKLVDERAIAACSNFAHDLELAAELEKIGALTRAEIDTAMTGHIEAIIVDGLTWTSGDWVFSSLARLRNEVSYEADTFQLLLDYARCVPNAEVLKRFRSVQESFQLIPERADAAPLQPHEEKLASFFNEEPNTIEELRGRCPIPENGMLQGLYTLWLGGVLERKGWNAAFSPGKIGEIKTARLSRVKRANEHAMFEMAAASPAGTETPEEKAPEIEITLDEFLARVEAAKSFYEVLGVADRAATAEIKRNYFGLAKLFHPDKFYREQPAQLRRIQSAFSQIAQAYEALKRPDTRKAYDEKLVRERQYEIRRKEQTVQGTSTEAGMGIESFEEGIRALHDEDYETAVTLFSRAVHYNAENALYHAYLGQALGREGERLHKAEAELQQAVRLDPKNSKIRIMLVEFFMERDLLKRAEGELNRFLEIVPDDPAARKLLTKLSQ